jgi:hypothetical protein
MSKKFLLNCLFVFSFLIFNFTADATNYYVSSSGSDSNSGTDPSSPWQTISKVNSFRNFTAGDNILFRRGDTFYGGLVISNSGRSGNPITYGAYGSGAKPIITGFATVNSWTNLGGNIWESNSVVSSLNTCNQVAVNNVNTPMGRYPNEGYLVYESFSGNTSITSSSLSGTNWAGAYAVIRKHRHIIDKNLITSQSGGTLYYSGGGSYTGKAGWGFFIQNDSRTLDQQNEWYFNNSNGKFRIFSSTYPSNIQISSVENLVYSVSKNYINISDLSLTGANNSALYIGSSSNVEVKNCEIDYCYNGVLGANYGGSSANFKLENSTLDHSNNNAISLTNEFTNAYIGNNIIKNSGMIVGMAGNGDGTSQAISISSSNSLVEGNEVDNTGYVGIGFNANYVTINKNVVNNFCINKDDGGGIYSGNPAIGNVVSNNIVTNGPGNGEGTLSTEVIRAHGIFLDDNATGVSIINNSIANIGYAAIFLHNAKDISITGNTTYNSNIGLLISNDNSLVTSGITIQKNTFVGTSSGKAYTPQDQKCIILSTIHNNLTSFGNVDNNCYARPIDENSTLQGTLIGEIDYTYNLATWQSAMGYDINSTKSPKTISNKSDLRFEYNPTSSSKTISLGASYIDMNNQTYNGSITLAPYTSAALIKNGETIAGTLLPAVYPSNTVNGVDYKYYESGSYVSVPSFDGLTPVKTGESDNFDISLANRSTAYSFNFTGYIDVPSDGQYTFYTTSDDGSKLYIDNVLVVDNDGLKSATEKSGVIGLKAGKHVISVGYFQQSGDNVLSVSYAGPGLSKQNIPNSSLFRVSVSTSSLLPAVNPSNTVNGLDYKYYEAGSYSSVPSFSGLTPVKSGTIDNFDISLANRSTAYSFNFTGYIDVPSDGQYTFYTISDDGSNLFIDGVLVVDNDGLHSAKEGSGIIGLKAGKHSISVGYFQQGWDNTLNVSYSGSGVSKQKVPNSSLYRVSTSNNLLPAVNPSNTVNGLDYKYYEAGSYNSLPSFNELTPVKTGTTNAFDISLANRSTAFSFNFTGYVDVPSDGQYTFYTTSDDGSNLYIDGVLVVNNDVIQRATERSGVIGLKAGKHALSVGYFQQSGDMILSVSYAGPGVSKQNIPASALFRSSLSTLSRTGLLPALNPSNLVNGLDYKYYEASSYSSIPSFNELTPQKTGSASNFDVSLANRSTAFSFNFTGFVDIPVDGQYTFYTTSDDGSNLYIDNVLVVNNDGLHSARELSGVIGLQAGKHAISVGYFQQGWDNTLSVSYAGPVTSKQPIPEKYLYRIQSSVSQRLMSNSVVPEVKGDSTNNVIENELIANSNHDLVIKATPNPFNNLININISGISESKFQLMLLNVTGQEVWSKNISKGTNFYSEVINTSTFARGFYFLRFIQDNKISVIKLIKQY